MIEARWKRPTVLPSKTHGIKTPCGTLYITLGYEEDKLIEVVGVMGNSGTCGNVKMMDFCKAISMYLQSPEPRYKIIKKLQKQYVGSNCGTGLIKYEGAEATSCDDIVAKLVITELEKQI